MHKRKTRVMILASVGVLVLALVVVLQYYGILPKRTYSSFQAYALELTCDITDIDQWQPGDIVIFNEGKHIGVVSDLRNRRGQPYILHNAGQFRREEDYLGRSPVEAHFRFDASRVPQEVLVAWGGV